MSGGSWDYFFQRVRDVADALEFDKTPYEDYSYLQLSVKQKKARHKLGKVLRELIAPLKAIEWVDSGDCSEPHGIEEINKFFDKLKKEMDL